MTSTWRRLPRSFRGRRRSADVPSSPRVTKVVSEEHEVRDNSVVSNDDAVPSAGTGSGTAPTRVFMSYRRADDHNFIGRLHDRLCGAFGDDMVFRDIDSIPGGANFRSVILRTLNEVDAVVAVIGPRWVRDTTPGQESADYVYLELAEALKQGKPVIPVLMEGTPMPRPDLLPADLRPLTEINAISVLADPAFRRDSARLIDVVRNVIATDRERIAEERRATEESARRVEVERLERERLAEQLREEERAVRARLAELEEAATRRQIEAERARLDAIAEQLRRAEPSDEGPSTHVAVEMVETVEEVVNDVPPPAPTTTRSVGSRVVEPPTSEQLRVQAFIIAAVVLGVVALFVNRSETTPFNEFGGDWKLDAAAWILTLAVGVPLLLARWPIEQRAVLIGATVAAFFFQFLQASAVVRYGGTNLDEGTWFFVSFLQAACLVGAIWTLARRPLTPLPTSSRLRIALVVLAIVSSVLLVAATYDEWNQTGRLVESDTVADRTPVVAWLLVFALGPVAITIALALHRSLDARISLAVVSTLAVVTYLAQSSVVELIFDLNGGSWVLLGVANMPLAALAWATSLRGARPRSQEA
jgi:TIR domain